jgi:lipopolysaccharide export system protein LptA
MYNKKSVNIILVFGVFTLLIIFQSFNVNRINAQKKNTLVVQKDSETVFNKLNYYSVENSKPQLNINADLLKIINSKLLYFTKPVGFLVKEDEEKIKYQADKGSYRVSEKILDLEGLVTLVSSKGEHSSDKLYFDGVKKYIEASGEVSSVMNDVKTSDRIIIESNSMKSWMEEGRSLFVGDVRGKVSRKRIYEESFDFRSEKLELNQLKSLVRLSKSVKLDRNNYHLEAEKAEIFLENFNKKLKYYVLYDDIKLVEKLKLRNGKSSLRKAFSEKLEGYMSEAKVVLSGAPRVESGSDLIKGYQITLRENVELVEVDDSQSSFELKRK